MCWLDIGKREPNKLYLAPRHFNIDRVLEWKGAVIGNKRCVSRNIISPSDKRVYIAGNEKWFVTYIIKGVDRLHDSRIAEVEDTSSFITFLEHNG